jgi:hypothetical protein
MTLQFLKDTASIAATEWENSLARVRSAHLSGAALDRAKLDSEIARRRYEALSAKVGEAEMMQSLEKRQQGATLEVLDPASLPSESQPSVGLALLLGAAIGAICGWLIGLLRAPGLRTKTAAVV